MGLDKDDQEVQTDNNYIQEYEDMIESQKKGMQTLQKENSQLLQQIQNLQQEIQKQKDKATTQDQKLSNKGSYLMSPQKSLRNDHNHNNLHQSKEADEQVELIKEIIQKDAQFENAEIPLQQLLCKSPDPTDSKQSTQIINKKNLISNKEGVVIKRDSSKPTKLKKKKVFDRLFQDSKDKANRLELLKKHLDQMESFQWEEVLTMLNLYSKEPDQNNDDALLQLQQKLQQDKFIPYGERNQAANREKNLKDFVLNKQFSNPSSPQTEPMQNQSILASNKINKSQRPLTRAEYFYKKQSQTFSGNNTLLIQDGNIIINRKQSQSPNNQKECDDIILNTFQELNQENYEKKKQYMDQLYDNFKKHNNRIRSSQNSSHNTSQDEHQMKITLLDKKKRSSNLGRLATEEAKGLQFYDTSDKKVFYATASNNRKPGQYNFEDFTTFKNQQLLNPSNSRTHSLESPRNILSQNTKKRIITSSQGKLNNSHNSICQIILNIIENKRIVTKRTVINTEKILKQKEEQKEANIKISDRVEKMKDQIRTSIATNNSVFVPDSIYSVIKGKTYQIPSQQNIQGTGYSQNSELLYIQQNLSNNVMKGLEDLPNLESVPYVER